MFARPNIICAVSITDSLEFSETSGLPGFRCFLGLKLDTCANVSLYTDTTVRYAVLNKFCGVFTQDLRRVIISPHPEHQIATHVIG